MFKATVQKWVSKKGRNYALARLIERGWGTSTAQRVVDGTYDHEIKGTNLTTLTEEMAKDGIVLTDEAS